MVEQLAAPRPAEASGGHARTAEGPRTRDGFILLVGLIGILFVWLRPLGSSLWLDETGTFWVLQGSLGDVVHRALDFQGQFPLYHVALWGWSRIAGTSEIALRLPSLAGALLAAWLCGRLALRLFGDAALAAVAACVFVLLPPVAFAAADARPYALALAALLGATLTLLRWLRSERPRDGLLYVGLTALTLSLHYLFVLALVSHVVLSLGTIRRLGRRGVLAALAAVVGVVLLLAPTIPHFVEVLGRRDAMSLFTYGSVRELLAWLAPPAVVLAFLAGRFATVPDEPLPPGVDLPPERRWFLLAWLVVPPLALYLFGLVSGVGLFAERHFLSSVPALALLGAAAFAILGPRRRRIAVLVLAILFVLGTSSPFHARSDWRGAARAADAVSSGPGTPILVYTGFSESRQMAWILDPERSQLFLAPLAAYPVTGRTSPLPFSLTDRARDYVEGILAASAGADRIVLITSESTRTYDTWLAERAGALGFTGREIGEYGDVRVVLFERREGASDDLPGR